MTNDTKEKMEAVDGEEINPKDIDYDLSEAVDDAGMEATEAGEKDDNTDEVVADDSEARLETMQKKVDEYAEQMLRLQADMENLRKRNRKEVENAHKFSLEKIAKELLSVRDSLEMGLSSAGNEDTDIKQFREGMDLTLKSLTQAMEKFEIVAIDPTGEKFNPEFHQAMSMQVVDGVEPNQVTLVMQKGYTLNDRLIRPALVMVSK